MGNFLKKLIPKNIAGIVGVIEDVFNVIRELLMVVTRICATIIHGDAADKIVAKIKKVFKQIESVFEKLKAFLL